MKFSISTDGNNVSEHFGRCPQFTIGEVKDGDLISKELIDNPGHHPGFLPEFLSSKGVDCIVAGGMGQRAVMLFADKNIQPVLGVSGSVLDVIEQIKQGTLKGGESLCAPGAGKGYGVEKTECTHDEDGHEH